MTASMKWPEQFLNWPSSYVSLPIEQVSDYPLLDAALKVWRDSATDGLPSTLDPLDLPPALIKGISLLFWDEDIEDWVIRLSATLLDDGYGRSMRGERMANAFRADDAPVIRDAVKAVVDSGRPDLMRREYMDREGRVWSFVRLVLPLSSDGGKPDSYAFVIDPEAFGRRIDP
ncbi:PAS domain-containing protein [Thalassobaculum sp. OXR-137]|uniref:PAS domain-containing protein n=1 Tax=Thalassobaculum sp. OXR-137 TaxID=3100173 RepID=UPI002AC9BDB9|nr:PAS domain-containing protein [Thalassobaculum sp. OXR-137]WPZ33823.1 PAS domain-containing protein [Thalassobaculum sp. OXR-137]